MVVVKNCVVEFRSAIGDFLFLATYVRGPIFAYLVIRDRLTPPLLHAHLTQHHPRWNLELPTACNGAWSEGNDGPTHAFDHLP